MALSTLELSRQRDGAPGVVMFYHLLLQLDHVLFQVEHDTAQFGVLTLEVLHLVLELGDSFELSLAALGRGHAISQPFTFQLDSLLVLHVDRADRRRLWHRLRFLLDHSWVAIEVSVGDVTTAHRVMT